MSEKTLICESHAVSDLPEMPDEQLVEFLMRDAPKHPALNRLHRKLVASSAVEAVITSYDRMYHRHNRS